jgi:Leucine-rich repeat (LRR) protein
MACLIIILFLLKTVAGLSFFPDCGKLNKTRNRFEELKNINESDYGCFVYGDNETLQRIMRFNSVMAVENKTNEDVSFVFNQIKNINIGNELMSEIFNEFPNLKILIFLGDKFKNLSTITFQNGSSLTNLIMKHEKLSTIEEKVFQNLENLELLDLQNNQLNVIDEKAFVGLAKLETLDLRGNQISELKNRHFEPLGSLRKLLMGDNRLKILPEGMFTYLPNLEEATFDSNLIQELGDIDFQKNQRLFSLEFGNNRVNGISQNLIKHFKKLLKLDLSNNYCVDQLFEYQEVPENSEKILRAFLYPSCDSSVPKVERNEDKFDWIEILIITVASIMILMIVSCMAISLCRVGKKKVTDTEAEQGVPLNEAREILAISNVIVDYTDQSTVHGVKYLGERRRHWTEKYHLISNCTVD